MLERRTFIVRVHAPDELPILEDVSTGELVRLPDLASIPEELTRRLHEADEAAVNRPDGPATPRERRP